MALLKGIVSFNTKELNRLAVIFPGLGGKLLSHVGYEGRTILYNKYLRGQEINLSAYPKDTLGRYTIISDVNKKQNQTKIYGYPLQLFELGRTLRDGSREAGHHILTQKLKGDLISNMPSYIREFEQRTLQKAFDKA